MDRYVPSIPVLNQAAKQTQNRTHTMTIPDLIDELLTELGVDPQMVAGARREAMCIHAQSPEAKTKVARELTDDEIKYYRGHLLLYFAALVASPEFREKVRKLVKEIRERN